MEDMRIPKRWLLMARDALIYGACAAVMTIALAFGAAALVGDDLERETQQVTREVLREAQETRDLICAILVNSDNQDIREAVREFC